MAVSSYSLRDSGDVNAERPTVGSLSLPSITDPNHNTTFREVDFCLQAVGHNSPSVTGVEPVSKIRYLSVVLSEDEKRSGLLLCVTSGTRYEGLRQTIYRLSRTYTHKGEIQTSE